MCKSNTSRSDSFKRFSLPSVSDSSFSQELPWACYASTCSATIQLLPHGLLVSKLRTVQPSTPCGLIFRTSYKPPTPTIGLSYISSDVPFSTAWISPSHALLISENEVFCGCYMHFFCIPLSVAQSIFAFWCAPETTSANLGSDFATRTRIYDSDLIAVPVLSANQFTKPTTCSQFVWPTIKSQPNSCQGSRTLPALAMPPIFKSATFTNERALR